VHGTRPNGVYVPRFRNVKTPHPDFLRGYGFQGGGGRSGWGRAASQPGFGVELKRALRTQGPWGFSLYGFGECLPRPTNYVEIDPEKVDAWGVPTLRIHCQWSDNERKLLHDMSVSAAEMLEAAGAKDVKPFVDDNAPGLTIHEMGTARTGRDPKPSVLNAPNPSRLVASKIERVGLQLYTVRHEMEKDVEGTIARVAASGYREVEFAGYFKKTPAEIRAMLDRHGLTSPSAHIGSSEPDAWS